MNEHLDRLSRTSLDGPADLVVEVVSEDSVDRDRQIKFDESAALGVPEYWIVEGREGQIGVECYELGPNRQYLRIVPDADGRLHSKALPGFWLDPAWLAQDPLPNPLEALRAIAADALRELVEGARDE